MDNKYSLTMDNINKSFNKSKWLLGTNINYLISNFILQDSLLEVSKGGD